MAEQEFQNLIEELRKDLALFKLHDHFIAGGERLRTNSLSNKVKDSDLSMFDITTNDVSTTQHGFTPKATNDTTKFLRDDATWAVPYEIDLPNTLATDHTAKGIVISKTAGENLVFGDVVYFKSDGKAWKSDANSAGTFPAVGLAIATISAEAAGNILLKGIARDDTWDWTIGGVLYLSISVGALTQTQPTATDDAIQVLGVAHPDADTIYWNPSMDYLQHI